MTDMNSWKKLLTQIFFDIQPAAMKNPSGRAKISVRKKIKYVLLFVSFSKRK